MRLDLADLRLFLCVAEAGSITQGAQQAHLALASASERLRSIEADAGVMLLQRHARGVRLTHAGETLAHHARLILRQQTQLRHELEDFANGMRGQLTLYANTSALVGYLPERLAPWLAARPQLQVELQERTSQETLALIRAGLAEAGLVSDALEAEGLLRYPLTADHLVLILPPGHRLAGRSALPLQATAGQAFVGLTHGNALQVHIEAQAQALGQALSLRIRMKTFDGLGQMVAQGVGLGIVPLAVALQQRRRHRLRIRPLADAWARRTLCLCLRDWNELSAPMHSLLTHLTGDERPARTR